jgi:3-methyladenine DNA glycosylase AlkD
MGLLAAQQLSHKQAEFWQLERPALVGVAALAEEIEERLRRLRRLDTQSVRAVRCEFSQRLGRAAPHVVFELAMLLLSQPGFKYRFVAYELVHHHGEALYKLNAWDLEMLGRGLDSWQSTDTFAVYLAGPSWRENRVQDNLIHAWARSTDRWWRRAALVSTIPLNNRTRGGTGEPYRTLSICRFLRGDPDPMVVRALSWALRELAKRDAKAVQAFVEEHGQVLAARVLREVCNKLQTGLRNPSRQELREVDVSCGVVDASKSSGRKVDSRAGRILAKSSSSRECPSIGCQS